MIVTIAHCYLCTEEAEASHQPVRPSCGGPVQQGAQAARTGREREDDQAAAGRAVRWQTVPGETAQGNRYTVTHVPFDTAVFMCNDTSALPQHLFYTHRL